VAANSAEESLLTLVPNEETGGEGGSAWLRRGTMGRGGIGVSFWQSQPAAW